MKTRQHKIDNGQQVLIYTDNGTVHTLPLLRPSHGTVTATVRRERGPEGWLQGNKVTDDDDAHAEHDANVPLIIIIRHFISLEPVHSLYL